MDNNTIIALKNIVVDFDGEAVLNGLSLDIHDKEFVTLLGPSGCGKTTTLRVIGGFLEPKSGNVFFNGKDITMNVCIQIRDVVKLLQEHFQISFEEAVLRFYKSETYKTLQETENGLWAESAEYIADRYYEETAG